MPAGVLVGGAAGMEDGRAFLGREAGQVQLLKDAGGHVGDLGPMFDRVRGLPARLANLSISWITFKLKSKELQGKRFETCGPGLFPGNECRALKDLPEAGGEGDEIMIHAVFVCRLVFRHSRKVILACIGRAASTDLSGKIPEKSD